jgi:hypothetical protein
MVPKDAKQDIILKSLERRNKFILGNEKDSLMCLQENTRK